MNMMTVFYDMMIQTDYDKLDMMMTVFYDMMIFSLISW